MDFNDILQLAIITFAISLATQLTTKIAGMLADHILRKAKETAKTINDKVRKE